MHKRTYLRLRMAAFFAAIGVAGSAAFAGALFFAWSRSGGPTDAYVTAGLIGCFALLGLTAWIGFLFDENVSRPIMGLARALRARASTHVEADINENPGRYLGQLAPAVSEIHAALLEARQKRDDAIAEHTARIDREKALLGTLIRDLSEAVIVVSSDARVLLFNDAAEDIFGPLSLDRRLERYLITAPLDHHLKGTTDSDPEMAARFLSSTVRDGGLVAGTISEFRKDDDVLGHVLVCQTASDAIHSEAASHRSVTTFLEEVRRPTMNLGAMMDVLDLNAPEDARTSEIQTRMRGELANLSSAVMRASDVTASALPKAWPREMVSVDALFDLAFQSEAKPFVENGRPLQVACDVYFISHLIGMVTDLIASHSDRADTTWAVEAGTADSAQLGLRWSGKPMGQAEFERFLDQPFFDPYPGFSSRDILSAMSSEMWIGTGCSLHLSLPRHTHRAPSRKTAKPLRHFFDFHDRIDRSKLLSDMSFVVFDTETTGLDPQTDEVVQIAGVRILHGEILVEDEFDLLVNPERNIPAFSTDVHGITNEMVAGAPKFIDVAREFHDYVDDAVLVAHNAAFDMAFLDRIAKQGCPKFSPRVLCTAQLSQALDPQVNDHTLDAVAERYGVEIEEEGRHTALGDAYTTARVFQKMISVLNGRSISTFDHVLDFQGAS